MRTAEQYQSIYLQRQQDFHDWHQLIAKWEKWYYLEHYYDDKASGESAVEKGAGYQHIDSAPADYVNQLLGTVTTPKISRSIQTDDPTSRKHQEIADQAEKFLAGAWAMNRARQTGDPIRAIYFNQLVRSMAYIQVTMDEDRLALYKKAKGIPRDSYFPICIDWLNPLTCFPDPNPGRWSWTDQFIRAEGMTPSEVAAIWGEDEVKGVLDDPKYFDSENNLMDAAEIDYLDIWEWEMHKGEPQLWNAVVYNGTYMVKPRHMEKYKDIPIVPIPGWDLPSPLMAKRYQSPLQPMIQSVRTQERIVNRVMTSAAFSANPIMKARNMRMTDISNHPGAVIPVEDNQDISYLVGVTVPPIMLNVFQLVNAGLNRSSLSPAHYGDAPATWSGFMLNQAVLASSIKTQPLIENLSRGLSMIDQRVLDLVAAYFPDEKIAAYGNHKGVPYVGTVKGSEVEGLRVIVTLTPKSPTDEQARFGLAAMARNVGQPGGDPLMPDDLIQTDILNVEDTASLRKAIYKQKLMQLPSIMKWTMLAALKANKDLPQDVLNAAAKELEQQLGMQQAGGPPGAPPQAAPQGAAGAPPMQGQQQGGAQPNVQEIIAAIDEALAAGGISQELADQAKQRLQSGEDPKAVMEWLKQQIMGQGGGQPPQGQPPQQQGAPQQGQLRSMIEQAVQADELDPTVAQQALAMLDQGKSEQEIIAFLEQTLQQVQGQAQATPEIPSDITLEQAVAILTQSGAPQEAIMQLQALVQQGTPVAEALQQIVLQYSGVTS